MKPLVKKILIMIFLLILVSAGFILLKKYNEKKAEEAKVLEEKQEIERILSGSLNQLITSIKDNTDFKVENFRPPNPPIMSRMKKQGCVVDGMLNVKNEDAEEALEMINRSNCYYLHRSIETWLEVPDFEDIRESMEKIERENVVYGMFIAEAIDTKADFYSKTQDRELDFGDMCKKNSKNNWGEHTCIPSLKEEEYQIYVFDLVTEAIDLGVQSFMFGQIHYQDDISKNYVEELLKKIRDYAKFRGVEIVIGAQTNDIEKESYLKIFDFIEGGVGINEEGKVEEGPCFSRWWKKKGDWCWALLWHNDYRQKAKNVFVHLDWSGVVGDDMSIFARMSKEKRAETLKYLDKYFAEKNVGFIMPMLAVLHKENGGCHGESRKFYSADNQYSCGDEDVINELLMN
jgi:hypothetical protein